MEYIYMYIMYPLWSWSLVAAMVADRICTRSTGGGISTWRVSESKCYLCGSEARVLRAGTAWLELHCWNCMSHMGHRSRRVAGAEAAKTQRGGSGEEEEGEEVEEVEEQQGVRGDDRSKSVGGDELRSDSDSE